MKDPKTVKDYVNGILAQDRLIMAKAMTLVESTLPADQKLAGKMLAQLAPQMGKTIRLGVTGVPGAGKSTLLDGLGMYLIQQGYRVAVLAIDPSSSLSGGSILADKTRMEHLSQAEEAFIRPSPTRGHLGGVAHKTRELRLICEAAGFDVVIIETVGVGQSEIEVASMVDFFLVLMLSGGGDELQGIKKGIMELADAIIINKADLDNKTAAQRAQQTYQNAINLLYQRSTAWCPPVLMCSALYQEGIEAIWDAVLKHQKMLIDSSELKQLRAKQSIEWMWRNVEADLKQHFLSVPEIQKKIGGITKEVKDFKKTPMVAAKELIGMMVQHTK